MAPRKVILLACGSFNPPTNMHLRMFELARDNLNRLGQCSVIGGIVSPVHDAYGKKELVPGSYRCEMLKLALKSSDWIRISDWECSQETWSRTRRVLQYHQNLLNSVLNNQTDSPNNNQRNDLDNGYDYSSWITNEMRNSDGPVLIKLLCGADLLESFATPGLWADEDIETIVGQHGIVVITRQGTDPRQFIYESDILTKYQNNICIVTEWITNDVSSTKVRRALRRHESVKYLLEDSVIEFIKKHELYGTTKNNIKYDSNLNQHLTVPINTYILTPSPSDVNMISASCSGNDIYLSLNPIPSQNQINSPDIIPSPNRNPNIKTFQSAEDIKFYTSKEKIDRNQSDGFQEYPAQAVAVFPSEVNESFCDLEQKKKVGFFESENISDKSVGKVEGDIKQDIRSDSINVPKRPSKKLSKLADGNRVIKAESEKNDNEIQSGKGNLLLRRSKSDAVMSRQGQNGETVSVKIQFTKDGIKALKYRKTLKKKQKTGTDGIKSQSRRICNK